MVENPFAPDVVQAVARHMNNEHDDDALMIVQTLGGMPEATAATVTFLDGAGVEFAVAGGGERTVRVPWSRPLTERPEIRQEFVRMYHEAAKALGVPPRQPGQH